MRRRGFGKSSTSNVFAFGGGYTLFEGVASTWPGSQEFEKI